MGVFCNPDQSKHLETARMRLFDVWIDFVNLRFENYNENSRIPTMAAVVVVTHMVNVSSSMRSYVKGLTSSPLIQFSGHSEENNDNGDGGGVPVFKFWSIPHFETLVKELVQMFGLELTLKRMLLVELLSISSEELSQQTDALRWSDELYPEEFDDLTACNLYSEQACEPVRPIISGWKSVDSITKRANIQPDQKALEVYWVTSTEHRITQSECCWTLTYELPRRGFRRVDEIFAIVGEEMQMHLFSRVSKHKFQRTHKHVEPTYMVSSR